MQVFAAIERPGWRCLSPPYGHSVCFSWRFIPWLLELRLVAKSSLGVNPKHIEPLFLNILFG